MTSNTTRRRVLLGSGVLFTSALAGCSGTFTGHDGSTPASTTTSAEALQGLAVYVASGVTITLPDSVSQTQSPGAADLILLPDHTDVSAENALSWLLDGSGIGLVGSESQSTMHAWETSQAYHEKFQTPHAYGESSPPPDLLVAYAVGTRFVTTHDYTWGNSDHPTNRELVTALNDAVHKENTRTTPST